MLRCSGRGVIQRNLLMDATLGWKDFEKFLANKIKDLSPCSISAQMSCKTAGRWKDWQSGRKGQR